MQQVQILTNVGVFPLTQKDLISCATDTGGRE
uniref:Uncharacterized protein n=1 Tax=Picea glauca TaxID=3330 RepID=A0A101LUR5_PICGL|nr:hypothetical protein ABT39_MTgene2542 [Picea glauca]